MVELFLLGGLDLKGSDGESLHSVLSHPKRVAVLTYLILGAPRGYLTRDRLISVFWPESDESHARNALSQILHGLRRSLGEDVILTRGTNEVGISDDHLSCDAVAFIQAVQGGDFKKALELYLGDFLLGFHLPGEPGFEEWAASERGRLREMAARAGWVVAHELLRANQLADGKQIAQRAVDCLCTDEGEARRFIRALAEAGDRAGAVQFYELFAQRLREELDLEPDPLSRRLVEEVRAPSGDLSPRPPRSAMAGTVHEGPDRDVVGRGEATTERARKKASTPRPLYERFVLHLRDEPALGPSADTIALGREIRGSQPSASEVRANLETSPGAEIAGTKILVTAAPTGDGLTRSPTTGEGAVAGQMVRAVPTRKPGFGHLRRHLRWMVPLAAIPLLSLAGLRFFSDNDPDRLERDARIAVLPPVNHTGDPDLGFLSFAVVGAIIDVLDLADIGRTVALAELVFAADGDPGSNEAIQSLMAEWRERTNASLALMGGYYRQGDSVHFSLFLAGAGDTLRAVAPVVAHREEIPEGISELQFRVVSEVAGVLAPDDFQWSWADQKDLPRDLHSYKDLSHAVYVYGTEGPWAALPLFEAVAEHDPDFPAPVSWLIGIYWGNGMPAQADSLCTKLEARKDELSPWPRLVVGMNCDAARGEHRQALAKAKLLLDYSSIYQCRVGFHAMDLNKPEEAAEAFERYDASVSPFAAAYANRVLREQALAYHWLGEYGKELATVREAQELFPQDPPLVRAEIRALIALGRTDEIGPLIEQGRHLLARNSTPRSLLQGAAAELLEHGHPDRAKELWERLLAWYDERPPGERQVPAIRRGRAETLLHLNRTVDALPTLNQLAGENRGSLGDLGRLGVAWARLGRTDEVESTLQALEDWDDPYTLGTNRFWQAAIAAATGEIGRSMRYLNQAVEEGMAFRDLAPHQSPFLRPLQGEPAFQEFLIPKG